MTLDKHPWLLYTFCERSHTLWLTIGAPLHPPPRVCVFGQQGRLGYLLGRT